MLKLLRSQALISIEWTPYVRTLLSIPVICQVLSICSFSWGWWAKAMDPITVWYGNCAYQYGRSLQCTVSSAAFPAHIYWRWYYVSGYYNKFLSMLFIGLLYRNGKSLSCYLHGILISVHLRISIMWPLTSARYMHKGSGAWSIVYFLSLLCLKGGIDLSLRKLFYLVSKKH